MRKVENRSNATFGYTRPAAAVALFAALLCGCAASPGTKEGLTAAYQELDNPTPNSDQIIQASDAYLQESPNGPAAADALYLKGRALEAKAQRDVASAQRDEAEAYNLYSQALTLKPRPALEGAIHAQMGNVLYFQDRYAAALNELSAGYEKLDRDSDKAWALYRIGLCHQRMAHWAEADQSFAAVEQQYPGTVQAQRAREHQGNTAFWVQVGTYASPNSADAVTAELKKQGTAALRFQDNARHVQYVRVGPFNSYESAVSAKKRLTARYRDAIVVP